MSEAVQQKQRSNVNFLGEHTGLIYAKNNVDVSNFICKNVAICFMQINDRFQFKIEKLAQLARYFRIQGRHLLECKILSKIQ